MEGVSNDADSPVSGGSAPETRLHTVFPRLPIFSGDTKDTSFDLWRYEVECLRCEQTRETDIQVAIRRSLKGQASRTLMSLGVGASVEEILTKFQSVFGPNETAQTILSRFFGLKQAETESAGAFAARLEDTMLHAVQLGAVEKEKVEGMLCEAFGQGLRRETRLATYYLFPSKVPFTKLVFEVKMREEDQCRQVGTAAAVQASETDALKSLVLELRMELSALKRERAQQVPAEHSYPAQNYASHDRGQPPPNQPMPQITSRRRGSGAEVVCWRCNMPGHVRSGCRMPLNGTAPVGRGRPQAQ